MRRWACRRSRSSRLSAFEVGRACGDSKGVRWERALFIKVRVRRVGRRRLWVSWAVRAGMVVGVVICSWSNLSRGLRRGGQDDCPPMTGFSTGFCVILLIVTKGMGERGGLGRIRSFFPRFRYRAESGYLRGTIPEYPDNQSVGF